MLRGSVSGTAPHTMNATRSPDPPERRPGRESDIYEPRDGRDEFGRIATATSAEPVTTHQYSKPQLGPLHANAEFQNKQLRGRSLNSTAGSLITYGALNQGGTRPGLRESPPPARPNTAVNLMLSTDETTLPGDLLVRKHGLPIKMRMAALVRQRSLDLASLFVDYLSRAPFSKMGPQRGTAFIDIPTFRRCLCCTARSERPREADTR